MLVIPHNENDFYFESGPPRVWGGQRSYHVPNRHLYLLRQRLRAVRRFSEPVADDNRHRVVPLTPAHQHSQQSQSAAAPVMLLIVF